MTRCTECNDYPAGTVCSYSGCPGKQRRAIAPQISDGDGWPFHMVRVPYRPDSFEDWRDGILEGLGSSAAQQAGFHLLSHADGVAHD